MKELIIWIVLWLSTWIVFIGFVRPLFKRYDFIRFLFNGIYFLCLSTLSFQLFRFSNYELFQLITISFATIVLGYILLKTKKYICHLQRKMKYFLVFHPLNILFQQSMIFTAINLLKNYLTNYHDVYFAFLFLLLHLPIILLKHVKIKSVYILASFIGGYLFSFLISSYKLGLLYSFLLHYLAYVYFFYKEKNIEY